MRLKIRKKIKKILKETVCLFILNISITKNNNMLTLTDIFGNTKFQLTTGNKTEIGPGLSGRDKRTFFAARQTGYIFGIYIKKTFNIKRVIIQYRAYRQSVNLKCILEGLRNSGIILSRLINKSPISHNGCRPSKMKFPKRFRPNRFSKQRLFSHKVL